MDKNIPKHIGIIMDGNRRFAKRLALQPWKGHKWGAKKVRTVMEWSKKAGIREITLYTLSLDNYNRPEKEFNMLMKIFEKELTDEEFRKDIHNNKIKINFIGHTEILPENIQKSIAEITDTTKDYKNFTANFAIAYGGRKEITDAVKEIALLAKEGKIEIDSIDADILSKHLSLKSEPDMIIRTGGEKRLSDFMIWQSAYSELFFTDTLWPELEEKEFIKYIEEFSKRKRRYGR
ncbi:MAG: di-trans,poly-cis-decaprenylcistransferase [Candidatus Aenigmarchaeota archaeon]|nr:di-trans,poly-cis-decaprenylcistransferase [Candidatus Aenigmarchaeota archaeon]MCK5372890.1 di-trans,poly-cis-decaprenylcistransferase [Candidatus Aenigmarchaeota archaeon]